MSGDGNIYDKVVTIGPDITALGGMAAVIKALRGIIQPFHYHCTNSMRGTVAGLWPMIKTMALLPIDRAKGRKILHIHSASGKSFVRKSIIVMWGKLLGFKIIFHSHGGKLPSFIAKIGVSKACHTIKRCDALVVLSEKWKEYYAQNFGHPHIYIINNFVEPIPESALSEADQPLRMLFLGVINHEKGLFDLLEVLAKNREKWAGRVVLTICGVGPEIEQMRQFIADHSLEEMAQYRGYVSGDEKIKALQATDVVTLPSYYEAQPVCIIEGLTAGKGIIASNVGGIPDLVTDGQEGMLVAPGDQQALSQAIGRYIDDRALLRAHAAAALKKSSAFSKSTAISTLNTLYRTLLG